MTCNTKLILCAAVLPAISSLAIGGRRLRKNIKMPDPVPREGIDEVVKTMESGKLFRYNVASKEESQVSLVEKEFSDFTGHKFAVGLNSCGSAIFLMLKCAGAQHGDKVLTNGFTFTAVPSAIVHAGCDPVYVETTPGYVVDVADLEKKMDANPDCKYFIVSHMRGKLASMDAIKKLCDAKGVELLEDCAHSLGVLWNGGHSGHHGTMAAFSSQSYKMLNSGEGGFFVTDDDYAAARCMAYAGAYEALADKHFCRPCDAALAKVMDGSIPNFSLRMHEGTAAMLRPQIKTIEARRAEYNERYYRIAAQLNALPGCSVEDQLPQVTIVGDSVQFNVEADALGPDLDAGADAFLAKCAARGLPVERFGSGSNARNFKNWKYAKAPECGLPVTADIISRAFDVRLPLLFEEEDFEIMVEIIQESLAEVAAGELEVQEQEVAYAR